MDFTFTEDQLLFQQSVREFFTGEVTTEATRAAWETDTGRSPALWSQMAELGLTGITVPEAHGGLGMSELDFVLLAQEAGYVALSEPLVHTALVAVPTLVALEDAALQASWLPRIAAGDAIVAVGLEQNQWVEDAHVADLLLLEREGALYAVEPGAARLRANPSVDPGRRLFAVDFAPGEATRLADGERAAALLAGVLNRGALGVAAQCLGLAQRMVDMSVQYTGERVQFGVAIGTFQAVKHHLANVAFRLEYARAPVHRAAYALAHGLSTAALNVSHAKLAATAVADLAAANSMQVHGAMGYTWEVDLHIFMKRAWAFNNTWGDAAFHQGRVADFALAPDAPLGAGHTFLP